MSGAKECAPFTDFFAARYTGWIHFPTAGLYNFSLASDDGSLFYLGKDMNKALIDDDGLHAIVDPDTNPMHTAVFDTTSMIDKASFPAMGLNVPFRLDYYENSGWNGLQLKWDEGRGDGKFDIISSEHYRVLINATGPPDIKQGPGGKYTWCDQVSFPERVGDGRCDEENNVDGCWDGGDCCQTTCSSPGFQADGFKCGTDETTKGQDYLQCSANLKQGLDAEFFYWTNEKRPSFAFDTENTVEVVNVPQINWPSSSDDWQEFNVSGNVHSFVKFALRITGFIRIKNGGYYTFYLSSDDGSAMWIDNTEVIDNFDEHGTETMSARMWLSAGFHALQVKRETGWCGVRVVCGYVCVCCCMVNPSFINTNSDSCVPSDPLL